MRIDETLPIHLNAGINEIEAKQSAEPSFADWLTDAVSTTNHKLVDADHALNQLASGQSPNLHQTMLTLEEAKLSFQFMEQVRNRLMTAYQDLLREPI